MSSLLVLGGARSGKSSYAQQYIEQTDGPLAYIATAQAQDAEMADRIARHRAERGPRWQTIETPIDLPRAIAEAGQTHSGIMVDCLTLWLTNLLLAGHDLIEARRQLIGSVVSCHVPVALVANEVGLGIVPDNPLARRFRDEAGWLNQALAKVVDKVTLIVAGLAVSLEG